MDVLGRWLSVCVCMCKCCFPSLFICFSTLLPSLLPSLAASSRTSPMQPYVEKCLRTYYILRAYQCPSNCDTAHHHVPFFLQRGHGDFTLQLRSVSPAELLPYTYRSIIPTYKDICPNPNKSRKAATLKRCRISGGTAVLVP